MPRPRSWTDEDLRRAVAASRSVAGVVRRLRLSHGGAAFLTVRTRIEVLSVDVSHFGRPDVRVATEAAGSSPTSGAGDPRGRSWDDDDLRRAVAAADSLHQVFAQLGLTVGGSQWHRLRALIRAQGHDTSHWRLPLEPRAPATGRIRALLTSSDLEVLVDDAPSRASLLRRLGIEPSALAYRILLDVFHAQGIDPARLDGRTGGRPRRPLHDHLRRDGPRIDSSRLRQRLIDEGLRPRACQRCGCSRWNGAPAPLQLDHVNGDPSDNRLENLRILCANCHAQTDTWGARNRGRGRAQDDSG